MHRIIQFLYDIIKYIPVFSNCITLSNFQSSLPMAYHPKALTFYVPVFVPLMEALLVASNL